MDDRTRADWNWFEPKAEPPPHDRDLARAFARCFASAEGQRVLAHLTAITRDRALGPEASDWALRHLEGQRHLVLHIQALAERGRLG
ncbi:MAG: hypothetical protein IT565_03840 [Rhodospirillales bacterium]|nr:hypothetical protein [Rhodospirillales bacterium]